MDSNKVVNIETFFEQLPRLDEKMIGNIFYRGQSKSSYTLTPSILRNDMEIKEHKIYSEIMTECAHEFENCKLHNETLSKMQHYGVPTRLLDVTTNALVALYFACESNFGDDGIVFVLKTDKSRIKQFDSDAISILASLPRFNNYEKSKILHLAQTHMELEGDNDYKIKEFNKQKIILRLLHEIKKEKPAFENIIDPADLLTNYYFMPRKNNARIIRQSGAFIIFGLGNIEIKIDKYFTNHESSSSYKIVIDNRSKQTIINQLSRFGISKASLHPELYKVAEYIKERYR